VQNVKGCSSALEALKLAYSIGRKSKFKSTPFLNSYRVVFLRHYVLRRKLVVLRKRGRLNSVAGSIVEYVNYFIEYVKQRNPYLCISSLSVVIRLL
jgi:hypothetical protein